MEDISAFVHGLNFRFLSPDTPVSKNYRRLDYRLGQTGIPLGLLNTRFPGGQVRLLRHLWPLTQVQGLSTFPIAAIINEAVRCMPPGQAYVNVGTWKGFTLFAGMLGNAEKTCVGVDNFSMDLGAQPGSVREVFFRHFYKWRSDHHEFFEGDYLAYLEHRHDGPIGVYLYDGEHSFENQLHALESAERFFVKGTLIMIDDAFADDVRAAITSFLDARAGRYQVVFDQRAIQKAHPTYWNGFLILRLTG